MAEKKEKIAIVSRSFWPDSPAIGQALLFLSESLAQYALPIVIAQVGKNFDEKLRVSGRGKQVQFSTLPSFTSSSSNIFMRIVELLLFTFFVFFTLCRHQPQKVYVATNPPLFTPLAVRVYCSIFNKKFIYHLQDIHPEATQVVTGKSNWITRFLQKIDVNTIVKASVVITLTEQMKSYLLQRIGKPLPILLLDNPSVQGETRESLDVETRKKGFVYCGNAGRLQRIPLLLAAIEQYLNEGGQLPFVFAGGGVYKEQIEKLAIKFEQVTYLGVLPATEAADLLCEYSYGLMPIDNEVTNYAFPSKSSSYVFSGCQVVAICGENTSVAKWVQENKVGFVVDPKVNAVVELFHELEKKPLLQLTINDELLARLTPQAHANHLQEIILQAR